MGLDITAYGGLAKVDNPELDAEGFPKDWKLFRISQTMLDWTEKNFPGRTRGLAAGIYRPVAEFNFCAGSYSGYGIWRDWLTSFAGYGSVEIVWRCNQEQIKDLPFVQLINFADNEGYIGPEVSAKLAQDFAEHQERAEAWQPGGNDNIGNRDFWINSYNKWRLAFETASHYGAVNFH